LKIPIFITIFEIAVKNYSKNKDKDDDFERLFCYNCKLRKLEIENAYNKLETNI
jgi:hypothetical protein